MSRDYKLLRDEGLGDGMRVKGTLSRKDELPQNEAGSGNDMSMEYGGNVLRGVEIQRDEISDGSMELKGILSNGDEILPGVVDGDIGYNDEGGGGKIKGTVKKKTTLKKHRIQGEVIKKMNN